MHLISQQIKVKKYKFMSVTVRTAHTKISWRLLTCKLDFCLPAENGPKCVGGDALIHPSVIDDMRIIDQQVPLYKAVVWIWVCVYFSPIHFPPMDKSQNENNHHHQTQWVVTSQLHSVTKPANAVRENFIFISPFPLSLEEIKKTSLKDIHGQKCNYHHTCNECTEMQM